MTPTAPVRFSEHIRGYLTPGDEDCERGYRKGRARGRELILRLTVEIGDMDAFLADPDHRAVVRGTLCGDVLDGRADVVGSVSLLAADRHDPRRRLMTYELRIPAHDQVPDRWLIGVKYVRDEPGADSWRDTTTLFVQVREGHRLSTPVWGSGKATIEAGAVLALLRSMVRHACAPDTTSRARRLRATLRYAAFFTRTMRELYLDPKLAALRRPRDLRPKPRKIPMFTLAGVPHAEITTHHVGTRDRLTLPLLRFRAPDGGRAPTDAVLLLHGLTSSSDMFIMPEQGDGNLVRQLHANGFPDVWSFDFRMSCRNPHNLGRHRDTLDDVALYDHPAAVEHIRAQIGPTVKLHVICHCLGSLTFMMSLFGRQVGDIASVVSNSVSLAVRVPWWSRIKLAVAPFGVERLLGLPYASPRWRDDPGLSFAELIARAVTFVHRECDEPACHMLSMMWGAGGPALFEHDNLLPVTHQRLRDLFGGTGLHYYRHVRAMVRYGGACKLEPGSVRHRELPDDYLEHARDIATPVLFLCGARNNVFADSNPLAYEKLHALVPAEADRRYDLRVVPGYGHQDIFMGEHSARDVFPHIIEFLKSHGGATSARTEERA